MKVMMAGAARAAAGLAVLLAACAQEQGPEAPVRGLVQLADDLYRVQDDFHFTVALVTPEGIILGDPLNADAAMWMREEFAARFGVPVRYVLYSHYHWDHASGARVFEDTATLVGHSNFPRALADAIATFPVQVTLVDANGDQRLDREEATGDLATDFDSYDTDGDGLLSGAEILADVRVPEVLYDERMTVSLGGKTVELIHPGPNHSTDTTVLFFPEERAVYGVDFLNVRRLALGFPGTGTLEEWIHSLKVVEALDFDIVSPGHSSTGNKADFSAYRQFFEDLQAVVTEAVASGTTLDELLASDALTQYSDLPNYVPQRGRNIEAAYGLLTR
ncbi:MAG: MBL fold metallo-hydrolase [Rhodospirillaceae bacterium]|nr:MBL fold metallo-hydrolase [Rhodospirillaceae bacterium]